jgi:hypothetical protein
MADRGVTRQVPQCMFIAVVCVIVASCFSNCCSCQPSRVEGHLPPRALWQQRMRLRTSTCSGVCALAPAAFACSAPLCCARYNREVGGNGTELVALLLRNMGLLHSAKQP